MNGFINVLKPVGATASDIVVCIKHVLHEKKVGHLGTLDPGASGVLPIAVGKATKLFDYLTNKVKYYRAFFTFGITTDTLDAYGTITDRSDILPSMEQVEKCLATFVGEIDQVPPMYSALSVGGVRAYDLARNGIDVELKARKVKIFEYNLVRQCTKDTFVVDIKCSGGTYIRSLARDLALSLNTVGYMSGLIRLSSGCFDIKDSFTLDEVKLLGDNCILPIDFPLKDLPTICFEEKYFDDICCGRRVNVLTNEKVFKVYCKNEFFGLGHSENGILKIDFYLRT